MKFSERVKDLLERVVREKMGNALPNGPRQAGKTPSDEEEADLDAEDTMEARTSAENAAIDKKLLSAKAAADKKRETAAQVSKIMSKRESRSSLELRRAATQNQAAERKKEADQKKPEVKLPKGLGDAATLGMNLSIRKPKKQTEDTKGIKTMKSRTENIDDRKYTQYHNMVKLYLEMCQNCKDDGTAAAKKAPEGQKQVAYNKARRGAENKRHGKPGESPRDTQVRRHGGEGIPAETPDIAKADAELDKKKRAGQREGKDWIGKAADSIEDRGTEGKCTPITKPGCTGRAKALAKTFKKIGRKRDKAIVSKEGK